MLKLLSFTKQTNHWFERLLLAIWDDLPTAPKQCKHDIGVISSTLRAFKKKTRCSYNKIYKYMTGICDKILSEISTWYVVDNVEYSDVIFGDAKKHILTITVYVFLTIIIRSYDSCKISYHDNGSAVRSRVLKQQTLLEYNKSIHY